jgi:hypothetical protein
MKDIERRAEIRRTITHKQREIAALSEKAQNPQLKRFLDTAKGTLSLADGVLGNLMEHFEYSGAEENERHLFEAVNLMLQVASHKIDRAKHVIETFGPNASPLA